MTEELNYVDQSNTPIGYEADYSDMLNQAGEQLESMQQAEQQRQAEEEDQGLLPDNPIQLAQELGTAAVGGAADAIESVGGFLELSGDTIKT